MGNALALDFIVKWHHYCHEIDDIVDLPDWSQARVLNCLDFCHELHSHPYYRLHHQRLEVVIALATRWWLTSVEWEHDPVSWKRKWADVLRHSGNLLLEAVAFQCGGWNNLCEISRPLLGACYVYHHDKHGDPI